MEIVLIGAGVALIGGIIQITYKWWLDRRDGAREAHTPQIQVASMEDVMKYAPPPAAEAAPRAKGARIGFVLIAIGIAALVAVGIVSALK
jgi:hypothetical protein